MFLPPTPLSEFSVSAAGVLFPEERFKGKYHALFSIIYICRNGFDFIRPKNLYEPITFDVFRIFSWVMTFARRFWKDVTCSLIRRFRGV